ncbi:MAG: hypothetical protein WC344_04545 [Bacilli bacterium]|jgi:uncharacterized membrane protein
MEKSFKHWRTYAIALGLYLLAAGIAFIPLFVGRNTDPAFVWDYDYIMLFSGVALLFVGYVWQDIVKAIARQKLHDWDNPLDKEIVDHTWAICLPFYIAAALSLVTGVIFIFITL